MSSIKKQLEADINDFFEQIDNQNLNDQKETLRLLLKKYAHLSNAEYLMDSHDLSMIVGGAKTKLTSMKLPQFLAAGSVNRKITPDEISNVCIVEATISHLNKKDCLKRLPKFDYKEDRF